MKLIIIMNGRVTLCFVDYKHSGWMYIRGSKVMLGVLIINVFKYLLEWSAFACLNSAFGFGSGSDFRLGKCLTNWGSEFRLNFERVDSVSYCMSSQESL